MSSPEEIQQKLTTAIASCRLQGLRLFQFSSQIGDTSPDAEKASPTGPISVSSKIKDTRIVEGHPPEHRLLSVVIEYLINIQNEKQPPLQMNAIYHAFYSVDSPTLTTEDLRPFAEINVPHNVYPYLREIVANMSWRMLETNVTLPLRKPPIGEKVSAQK